MPVVCAKTTVVAVAAMFNITADELCVCSNDLFIDLKRHVLTSQIFDMNQIKIYRCLWIVSILMCFIAQLSANHAIKNAN